MLLWSDMKVNVTGPDEPLVIRHAFDSPEEYAAYAEVHKDKLGRASEQKEWVGGTVPEVLALAKTGWDAQLETALRIIQESVTTVEQTTETDTWRPVWDVTGSQVDVGAYLSGEPECMIDYPSEKVPRAGRVITLCASITYSAAVSVDSMVRRGAVIAAFAMELSRLGLATELWADLSVREPFATKDTGRQMHSRILVKGTNDILDPAKVLFTYAHPGSLRVLGFAVMDGMAPSWRTSFGASRGVPIDPEHDLPDGTIYLPAVYSSKDVPDADVLLRNLLSKADFIETEIPA